MELTINERQETMSQNGLSCSWSFLYVPKNNDEEDPPFWKYESAFLNVSLNLSFSMLNFNVPESLT